MPELYKKAYATQLLIAVNIIIFLIETAAGGSENTAVAIRFGAFYAPYIIENGEWYRLFTSMFLHFGPEHIGTNMLSLLALGPYAERIMGRLSYIIIYIFSGICGNLLTLLVQLISAQYSLSAGASGAICGLLGVIIFMTLIPRFRKIFPIKNAGLALLCMIAPSMGDSSINLYAHVGGVIGGFVLTTLMFFIRKIFKAGKNERQEAFFI